VCVVLRCSAHVDVPNGQIHTTSSLDCVDRSDHSRLREFLFGFPSDVATRALTVCTSVSLRAWMLWFVVLDNAQLQCQYLSYTMKSQDKKLTRSFHESESLQASCMQANVYFRQYWYTVLRKEQHVLSEVVDSLRLQSVGDEFVDWQPVAVKRVACKRERPHTARHALSLTSRFLTLNSVS
jgi:hypothetical protein